MGSGGHSGGGAPPGYPRRIGAPRHHLPRQTQTASRRHACDLASRASTRLSSLEATTLAPLRQVVRLQSHFDSASQPHLHPLRSLRTENRTRLSVELWMATVDGFASTPWMATVLPTLKPSSVKASVVASDALPPALPPTLATTLAIGVVYGSERRMRRKASGGCPPLNSLPGPPPSILKCGTPLTPAW